MDAQIYRTSFNVFSKKGRSLPPQPVTMSITPDRIEFLVSPFALKDEIKAMKGSRWHGFDEDDPRKIWSVENCFRNMFQIRWLEGKNPYQWFERPIESHPAKRTCVLNHQQEDINAILTYHFQVVGDEPGLGKTFVAIEVMEQSGVKYWWYVSRKKPCEATIRQFKEWKLDPSIRVELMTYDAFVTRVDNMKEEDETPQGIFYDEASGLKNHNTLRGEAAQFMADRIRSEYGYEGYVVPMTGSPSPTDPTDIWSLAEIAWPGYLKEGNVKALTQRVAITKMEEYPTGKVPRFVAWRDNEDRCEVCGVLKEWKDKEGKKYKHTSNDDSLGGKHDFVPGRNEVSLIYKRLIGLMVRHFKKDCLDLPEKQYKRVICKPSSSMLRLAEAITQTTSSAMQGLTLLRELSDGFQYQDRHDGDSTCSTCNGTLKSKVMVDPGDPEREYQSIEFLDPDFSATLVEKEIECPTCEGRGEVPKITRIAREIPTPKEDALIEELEKHEGQGRAVIFAAFTGSVERCKAICLKRGWDVVRCDGRGFEVTKINSDGTTTKIVDIQGLDYWTNSANARVAFVAHPESGGQGLNLTEAAVAVFWSNSFKAEFRMQAEDRVHRIGADHNRGVSIVDLICLPSDEKILKVIGEHRKLELMLLGDIITPEEIRGSATAATS